MKNISKLLLIAFVALASTTVKAQSPVQMYKMVGSGSLVRVTTDTVTNTATNYLYGQNTKVGTTTAIQVLVTKQSGTPAGLVKLYGSLDGTNWSLAATTYFYVKNVSTVQDTTWVLTNNPFPWYKLSHTGVGTMASTLQGNIYTH